MSVCCECCVLSGRGPWDGLITRPRGVLSSTVCTFNLCDGNRLVFDLMDITLCVCVYIYINEIIIKVYIYKVYILLKYIYKLYVKHICIIKVYIIKVYI